jgi:hypothetical protein
MTWAPSAASLCAVTSPSPEVAPETTATRPSRLGSGSESHASSDRRTLAPMRVKLPTKVPSRAVSTMSENVVTLPSMPERSAKLQPNRRSRCYRAFMLGSERSAMTGVDLDDLDQDALDRFVIERAPELVAALGRDDAAIRLGLLAKVAPRLAPTQVGLYVFGKVPQYVAPEWGVACVAFDGRTLADPIASRVDAEGPLAVLVSKALTFVDEAQRGSSARYSPDVVREVVVNALVHRDLRRPSRVSVRVFADRLEVHSPGGPTRRLRRPRRPRARRGRLCPEKSTARVRGEAARPRRAARSRARADRDRGFGGARRARRDSCLAERRPRVPPPGDRQRPPAQLTAPSARTSLVDARAASSAAMVARASM